MTARDLFKRTPLRLAAGFAALFATAAIALFAVILLGVSARLDGQVRVQVHETLDALTSIDDQRDFDDLVRAVRSESASMVGSDLIFELVSEGGVHVAGNVRGVAYSPGWMTLRRTDIRTELTNIRPEDSFVAIWKPVSKGHLLVGASTREVRQTQGFLIRVLGYGLLGVLIAVGLTGAFLARQAQTRIEAFATTLSAVSQGKIAARVPMSGSDDDIDRVGGQINRTLDHLQQLIENVNQSSSDIAHDLKKPMGRLRQRLDVARRDATTREEFRAALGGALSDLDATMQTFDALLKITQIEAGGSKERFQTQDLSAVIDDVVDAYAAVAEDAGHTLTSSVDIWRPAFVRGDRELLVQLFANVVENSILHCSASTHIDIGLREQSDAFLAEVADRGPGIPKHERGNVFRRLYRLERARSTPGTGLGLSLAAAIVELHDAKIELSDNGPGLRVSILFPALAA
ncbi:MAG: ATP-binding protein [Hyphomicrobium sp.]